MGTHLVSLTSVLGLVAIAGCTPAQVVKQPASPLTIKVADVGIVTQAPFYIAIDRGYFREEGFEVELVPSRTTSEAATLVATSQVDFAGMGPDPVLFNALERGIGMKLLSSAAVFSSGTRASGLVVRQDHVESGRFAKAADLKGLRIAVSAAQSRFYVEQILAQAGLTADDVEFATLPLPEMVSALKGGTIDAGWTVEPLVGAIQAQGLGKLTTTGLEAFPGGIPWLVVESADFARANPDAGGPFMHAYVRGMRDFYYAFNKEDGPSAPVIHALASHSSVKDPQQLEKIAMHTVDPNGALDAAVLDRYQEYYVKTGDQKHKIDLTQYIDLAPRNAALARLGTL